MLDFMESKFHLKSLSCFWRGYSMNNWLFNPHFHKSFCHVQHFYDIISSSKHPGNCKITFYWRNDMTVFQIAIKVCFNQKYKQMFYWLPHLFSRNSKDFCISSLENRHFFLIIVFWWTLFHINFIFKYIVCPLHKILRNVTIKFSNGLLFYNDCI